jgi:hypothetical protein
LPDSALTAEGKELKDIEEQNEKETSVVKKKVDKMYEEHSWVRKHFNDAEIPLGNDTLATLPTNNELINFVGKNPVFVDTDEGDANQCAMFQQNVPKKNDRWIGIAGMFNSGTNALYRLLKDNCEMPGGNKVYWEVSAQSENDLSCDLWIDIAGIFNFETDVSSHIIDASRCDNCEISGC